MTNVVWFPVYRRPHLIEPAIKAFASGGDKGLRPVCRRHWRAIERWMTAAGASRAEVDELVDGWCRTVDAEIVRLASVMADQEDFA